MRSDWGQAEKRFNDSTEDGPGGGLTPEGGGGKALKDRFGMGRLSMIMKDLEPLREQLPQMSMPSLPTGFPSRPSRHSGNGGAGGAGTGA